MRSDEPYASVQFRLTASYRERVSTVLSDATPPRGVSPRQRSMLSDICSAPESLGQRPEQLLVAFKSALSDAADRLAIPHGSERDDLLARLVTAFIEEFFQVGTTKLSTMQRESASLHRARADAAAK